MISLQAGSSYIVHGMFVPQTIATIRSGLNAPQQSSHENFLKLALIYVLLVKFDEKDRETLLKETISYIGAEEPKRKPVLDLPFLTNYLPLL